MAQPNLASLLSRNADEIKRPVALPEGTYFGTVKSYVYGESDKKKTPYVAYQIGFSHAHDDVDLSEYEAEGGKPISEREQRFTLWLSEDAQFRAKEFVESCGVTTAGRSLGEFLPQVVGQAVVLDIIQKPTQDGEGVFNDIKSCKGMAAE